MARQTGTVMLTGTVGNLTFYEMNGKHFCRKKRHVSKYRLRHDAAFAKTRACGRDFGTAARAGKLVRETIKGMAERIKDATVTKRLLQKILLILKSDNTSLTGSRKVSKAMQFKESKVLLNGFEFNNKASVHELLLYKCPEINPETGIIRIRNIKPCEDVNYPKGATHLQMQGAYACIDFAKNTGVMEATNKVLLPIDNELHEVTLSPAKLPKKKGIKLFLLQIEFFQQTGNELYELYNREFNGLEVVMVV